MRSVCFLNFVFVIAAGNCFRNSFAYCSCKNNEIPNCFFYDRIRLHQLEPGLNVRRSITKIHVLSIFTKEHIFSFMSHCRLTRDT